MFLDARLPARFWSKTIPEPNSGCWLWTGSTNEKGYGLIGWQGKTGKAHRVAYVALVGGVPPNLEIDHRVCKLRCCVNPAHMEVMPHLVNVRRGRAGRERLERTSCRAGHEYTARNTLIRYSKNGSPYRSCRECGRLRMQAARRSR